MGLFKPIWKSKNKGRIATIMTSSINEEEFPDDYGILKHPEGVDLLPANIELSGLEVSLGNTMSREMILRDYIEQIRDYIYINTEQTAGRANLPAVLNKHLSFSFPIKLQNSSSFQDWKL